MRVVVLLVQSRLFRSFELLSTTTDEVYFLVGRYLMQFRFLTVWGACIINCVLYELYAHLLTYRQYVGISDVLNNPDSNLSPWCSHNERTRSDIRTEVRPYAVQLSLMHALKDNMESHNVRTLSSWMQILSPACA